MKKTHFFCTWKNESDLKNKKEIKISQKAWIWVNAQHWQKFMSNKYDLFIGLF